MQIPNRAEAICARGMNVRLIFDEAQLPDDERIAAALAQAKELISLIWPLLKERYKKQSIYHTISSMILWLYLRYPHMTERICRYTKKASKT